MAEGLHKDIDRPGFPSWLCSLHLLWLHELPLPCLMLLMSKSEKLIAMEIK